VTQEFHISVTPVGKDEYLVRTERVAPGVPLAEEQIRWPIEDWLAQARQLMNDPLLGLLQGDPPNPATIRGFASFGEVDLTQPPLSLVELGQQLYGALFQGTLRDSWVTAQGIAQHRNETLRLRLGLKGLRLPRLPWEVLYANDTPTERSRPAGVGPVSRPLTAGTHVIFSRYQPNTRLATESLRTVIEPGQPLRVLMVIAAPTDRERLELEQEAKQLQQELGAPSPSAAGGATVVPDIQLTILKQPGREQLTQALEQGRYQILHYAGHSDLGANGGSLYLVNNRTGLTEILTGNDLAGLLVNNGIRLAIFNSCRGAYTAAADSSNDQKQNLAETLVSRGIPAVLAMAEQIPDNVALTLTWLFYRNLKLGYPIDLSLGRARQGLISAYGSHQLYWALPILYLHPEFDGCITPTHRSTTPADRLVALPQQYGALPILTTEEVAASGERSGRTVPVQENRVTQTVSSHARAFSSADDLGELDDNYEEDVTLVADLLRQLTPPTEMDKVAADAPIAQSVTQNLSPSVNPDASPSFVSAEQSDVTVQMPHPQRQRSHANRWVPLLGSLGAAAVIAAGIWSYSQFQQGGIVLQFPESSPISFGTVDLQTADPEEVKTIAINHFNRQRYTEGEKAVTALLDRGELRESAEALAAVPTRIDTPEMNFLWGRLAWQGMETGSPVHTLKDARRYWELAAKADPDNAKYQEALGFAYYAENQPLRAMEVWMQALAVSDNQFSLTQHAVNASAPGASTPSSDSSSDAIPTEAGDRTLLTTYAGLALALWNTSIDQYPAQQENLLRKAVRIYDMVQRSDPTNFQVEALQRNWLWKDGAIRDWQALSRLAL